MLTDCLSGDVVDVTVKTSGPESGRHSQIAKLEYSIHVEYFFHHDCAVLRAESAGDGICFPRAELLVFCKDQVAETGCLAVHSSMVFKLDPSKVQRTQADCTSDDIICRIARSKESTASAHANLLGNRTANINNQ